MVVLMTLLLFLMLLLFAFEAGVDRGRKEIVSEAYESVKPVKLENAKLRELARLEHECNRYANLCMVCPHNGLGFEHDDYNCEVAPEIERLRIELKLEAS